MVSDLTLDCLSEGDKASFKHHITVDELNTFADLSGDRNPLHVDSQFARNQGYRDCVVHGAFFAGLVSRFVGMELPGRQSLLLSLKLDFAAPSFPGDVIEVTGEIDRIHIEQEVIVLKIRMDCQSEVRVRASAMVKVNQ